MAEEKKMVLTVDTKKMLEDDVNRSKADLDMEYMETCNVGFDLALTNGKGVPRGCSVLFYAEPGCGKTTLLADASRRLIQQAKDRGETFKVLYLASEGSKELLKKLGLGPYIESGDFIYIEKSLCWRMVETYYEAVLQGYKSYKDVKLIIIDSINNVLSDANQTKSVADGDFGSKAKERTSFYGKYIPQCLEHGVSSFFIAQVRTNTDAGAYGDPKRAAASFPDLHNVEIVVKCGKKVSATETKKVEIKTVFGTTKQQKKYIMTLNSSAGGCKNRYFEGTPSEVMIIPGKGIDNTYAVRMMLEGNEYIKKSGGWYTFHESLCESMGAPTTKLRVAEVNKFVYENMGAFIDLLKGANQYKLDISETDIEDSEEDMEDDE